MRGVIISEYDNTKREYSDHCPDNDFSNTEIKQSAAPEPFPDDLRSGRSGSDPYAVSDPYPGSADTGNAVSHDPSSFIDPSDDDASSFSGHDDPFCSGDPFFSGFDSHPDGSAPDDHVPERPDPDFPDPGYPESGYHDPDCPEPEYRDPCCPDSAYPDPSLPDPSALPDSRSSGASASGSDRSGLPEAGRSGEPVVLKRTVLRKKKKSTGKRILTGTLFILAVCIVCVISGICGGIFYAAMTENDIGAGLVYHSDGSPAILYQSVRTAESAGSVSDVASSVADSVVEIETEAVITSSFMRQYISQGAGSGVIISPDGYIVTNHHVISDAQKIEVTLRNGSSYQAVLVGSDPENDIAVLRIIVPPDVTLSCAVLGDSDRLIVGEPVVAIGNPLGELGGTVTDGIISALERSIVIDGQEMTLIQTNAAINPGNSGGGLFSLYGELVGIVNAKSSGSGIEGLGFVIPVNKAKPIISDLISYGYVTGKTSLGIETVDISDQMTAYMYRLGETGVYVTDVPAGSDGAAAGLQPGDRIVSVNGMSVSSGTDVRTIISDCHVGDNVTIAVSRNGQRIALSCTLTEYRPS